MNINFVDLGLPSGTLWGDRNLGADAPEKVGDYFRFGELNPLTDKSQKYKSIPTIREESAEYRVNTNIACTIYDVAQTNFNINLCIPNILQLNELFMCCNKEYIKIGTIEGMRFIGRNGAQIFLPAGGRMENGISVKDNSFFVENEYGPDDKINYGVETWGFYWGSNRFYYKPETSYQKEGSLAVGFAFSKNYIGTEISPCHQGFLIRPVRYVNQSDNKWEKLNYFIVSRKYNKS